MTATELDDVTHQLEALGLFTDAVCEPVVLLALADPDALVELDRHLTGHGFRVFVARSATEAVWECLEHAGSVDILVCDPRLPGLPAAELYRRLKVTMPWLRHYLLAPGSVGLAVR